jgi:hypothetical protein
MKAKIVLKFPKPATKVIAMGRSILEAMSDNAWFPAPPVSLATLSHQIDAAARASMAVLFRTKGNREARDVEIVRLKDVLEQLAAYVQAIANANPLQARVIIELAGMSAKKPSPRNKVPLAAVDGPCSGAAELIAKSAGDRAAYGWQLSLDRRTWTQVRQTLQSRTVLFDLTPGLLYFFRLLITTKDGLVMTTDVVSLLVR